MAIGKLPDHYGALGVPQDAAPTTIRSSYKKLMLQCHPDKVHDETQRAEKAAMFEKVQQAYEILSDSRKRRKYDEELSKGGARVRASTSSTPPSKEESFGGRDREREERRERSEQKESERRRRQEERRTKHAETYYQEPEMPPPPPRRSHTTGHRSYPPDDPPPKLHRSSTSARYASTSHSEHPQAGSPPRQTYGSSTHRYPEPEPSPRKKERERGEHSARHRSYEHPSPGQPAESTTSHAGTETSGVRMGYEEKVAAEEERKAKALRQMGLGVQSVKETYMKSYEDEKGQPHRAPAQRKESHGSAGTDRPHFPPQAMPGYSPHGMPHPHPSPAAYAAGYYPGYAQEPPEVRYQRELAAEEARHKEEKRRRKEEREREKQSKAKEKLSGLAGSTVGSDMPSPRERKPSMSSHKAPGYSPTHSHHRRGSSITRDDTYFATNAYIPHRAPLGGGAGMSSSASAVGGMFGGGPTSGPHVFGSLPTGAPLGTSGRPRRHSDVGSPTPEKMHASARMPPPAPPREQPPPAQTDSGYSSPSSPQNKDSSTPTPPAKSPSTSPNLTFPKKPVPSTPNPNPSPSGLTAAAAAAATPQADGSGTSWKRYTFEVFVREDGTTTTNPSPLPLPRRKTSSSHSTIDDGRDLSTIPPELIPHVLGNKEYLMRPISSSQHPTSSPLPNLANLHLDSASYASPPPSQHGDPPRSNYGGSGSHTSAHSSPRMHPAMHRHHTGSTTGSTYHPSPKMEPKGFSPSLPRSSTFHAPTSAPLGTSGEGKGVSPSSRRTPASKSFTPPGLAASHTFS